MNDDRSYMPSRKRVRRRRKRTHEHTEKPLEPASTIIRLPPALTASHAQLVADGECSADDACNADDALVVVPTDEPSAPKAAIKAGILRVRRQPTAEELVATDLLITLSNAHDNDECDRSVSWGTMMERTLRVDESVCEPPRRVADFVIMSRTCPPPLREHRPLFGKQDHRDAEEYWPGKPGNALPSFDRVIAQAVAEFDEPAKPPPPPPPPTSRARRQWVPPYERKRRPWHAANGSRSHVPYHRN